MKSAKNPIYTTDLSKIRSITVLAILLCISACSNPTHYSRYTQKQDTAPNFEYGDIYYKEVVPKRETPNKWNSKPYEINGKKYIPMLSAKGFEEQGQASWYGQKFHGHRTANNEVFDMFALSAAHKTLPLPSFVRVTNLQNGKKLIVRVNDRGPFHGNRILDLSYGAAKKLGFQSVGVTDIKMEVLSVESNGDIYIGKNKNPFLYENRRLVAKPYTLPTEDDQEQLAANVENEKSSGLFVQVMAIENADKAKTLAKGLSRLLQVPTTLPKSKNIYKLHLGPLNSEQKAQSLIKELKKIGFEQAFAVEVLP